MPLSSNVGFDRPAHDEHRANDVRTLEISPGLFPGLSAPNLGILPHLFGFRAVPGPARHRRKSLFVGVLLVGAAGFEPATCSTQNCRATRLRYTPPVAELDSPFANGQQATGFRSTARRLCRKTLP